jgi:branched-chain amino acid transport system permease protein
VIQDLVNAISLGALYALIALGISLIFGVLSLINFAYGDVIMVGAYAVLMLAGAPWYVILVGVVIATSLVSLVMERVAFRPVRGANPATLLVTSFAVSFLLQSVVTSIWSTTAKPVTLPAFVDQSFTIDGVLIQKLSVITLVGSVLLLVATALFLRRTTLGLQMRAASEDFLMTRLLGVRANRVIATAFLISGLLAGFVAVVIVSQLGVVTPTMGLNLTLIGFIATVVGGMASVPAAAGGGFLLGAATVLLQSNLPSGAQPYRDALIYGAVILILLLRPDGLLVKPASRSAA